MISNSSDSLALTLHVQRRSGETLLTVVLQGSRLKQMLLWHEQKTRVPLCTHIMSTQVSLDKASYTAMLDLKGDEKCSSICEQASCLSFPEWQMAIEEKQFWLLETLQLRTIEKESHCQSSACLDISFPQSIFHGLLIKILKIFLYKMVYLL